MENSERIRTALEQLPERDREVLQLHVWEELTAEQISQVLEVSPEAVWKRLQRARDRLAARLDAEADDQALARGLTASTRQDPMTTDDLYTEVRQADPAAGLDRDPDGAAPATCYPGSEPPATLPSAPPPEAHVVVLAAAAMAISTGAVASGLFEPDPQDLDTIVTEASEHADVHLPGWRPSLRAETVWGFYHPAPMPTPPSLSSLSTRRSPGTALPANAPAATTWSVVVRAQLPRT